MQNVTLIDLYICIFLLCWRTFNKLYPNLDDTMEQLQSRGPSSRPSKSSPVDRKPVIIDATFTSDTSTANSPVVTDTFTRDPTSPPTADQVTSRLSVSKQEHVDIVTEEEEVSFV